MSAPADVLTATARLDWRGAAVVVTVSADDPAILARRLDRALAVLAAAAAPATEARPASSTTPARPARRDEPPPPPVCAAHGAPLTWRTPKAGGAGWWSHRTAAGEWCRG